MKRILVITIAMLLLFCSCQKDTDTPPDDGQVINTGKTETYIVTGMNAELSIEGRENPWGNSRFEAEDAVKEKSVEILGATYAGTYERSYINEYHSYVTEYYWTEDRIELGFKAGTEELVHLNVMNSAFFDTEPLLQEKEAPRDYAVEKASEIAALWIDPTAYEVEVEVKDTTSLIEDVEYAWSYYYVTFIKYINGLKTTDFITVRITSKGNLASLVVGDLGAFDEFEKADCTPTAVDNSIQAAMQKLQEDGNRENQAHELKEQIVALTPDGEFVVCSTLTVTYRDAQEKKNYKGGVHIITKFGERAAE